MKAELETGEVQNRGIEITSENEDDKQILLNIWNGHGGPMVLTRNGDAVTILLAPTPEGTTR